MEHGQLKVGSIKDRSPEICLAQVEVLILSFLVHPSAAS